MTGRVKVDPSGFAVNGEALGYTAELLTIAMHKPAGFVCTHALDEGKNVYSLLPAIFQLRKPLLSSVGRLDRMATGLLLFTQDGSLNARLSSPASGCTKEYIVSLEQPLSTLGVEAAAFASGRLQLVDGSVCEPADLSPHAALRSVCRVALRQGRHHQLRRMFAAVGHAVTGIHRASFAGLSLHDLDLPAGAWRVLTPVEVSILNEHCTAAAVSARVAKRELRRRSGLGNDGAGGAPPPQVPASLIAGGTRIRIRRDRGIAAEATAR